MRNQTSSGTWADMVRCRGLPIAVANSQINIIMTQILTTGRDLLYTRYKGTLLVSRREGVEINTTVSRNCSPRARSHETLGQGRKHGNSMQQGNRCNSYQRCCIDYGCCLVESSAKWVSSLTVETSHLRQTNLQDTCNTNATGSSISNARTTTGITAGWMGGSAVGEMVKPGGDLRVHNTGTEGCGET